MTHCRALPVRVASIVAMLALCLSVGPHRMYQVRACNFPNNPEMHDIGQRFHRIFNSVVGAYGMDLQDFALCNDSADTMPATGRIFVGSKRLIVVRLPGFTEHLSDLALRGLLGHEIGHIAVGFRPYSLAYEIRVDLKAAEVVGFDAMIACHREMVVLLEQANPHMFRITGGRQSSDARLQALDAALKSASRS